MSIIDSSPKPKTVTLNNGALVSTLKSRFGGASLLLNGLNQYASIPEHTDFGFGTGDFTIEMWVYPVDNNNYRTLISMGTHTDGLLWRMCTEGNQLWFNGTPWSWGSASVPLHTWSHLALVRNSGTIKVYINGTESLSVSGGAAAGNLGSSRAVSIGAYGSSETFNGYLDEVRITKGINSAKYNSNFDVKTLYAPFPSSGTPVTPPNAPTDLIAGPLGQKINMIWTAPAEDNGGIITDYSIQFKADGETNWSDFAHTPSLVPAISVTGLVDGTTYSVRVGAINYIGVDAYVSESNLVPTEPAVDTNPDPYFYSTSLLLHFDGSHNSTTITDTSYLPKTGGTVQGDAKLSIAKNKFGGSSIYFDGSGDYLTVPDHPGFDFGAEDFTIEYWEYRLGGSGTGSVMCRVRTGQGVNPWLLGHNESGTLKFYMSVDYANWAFGSLSMGSMIQNDWTHYAVVRQGSTVRTYQNGSQVSTASFTGTLPIGGGSLSIGRYADNSDNYFHGYLDDIRITRGVCRYPDGTTFSVPALPFSNVAPTITAPTAPSNLTASGGDANAIVSWTSSSSDKTIRANYSLEYSEDTDPRSWTTVNTDNTRLLLHFNKGEIRGNSSIVDSSLYGREVLWNPLGPAIIGGASSPGTYQKFGNGCLEIPYNRMGYSSPYIIKVAESSDLNPGTGDYTLEMFLMSESYYYGSSRYRNGGVGRLFGSYNGSSGSYFGFDGYDANDQNGRITKYVNGSAVYNIAIGGSLNALTEYNYGGYTGNNYNVPLKHLVFCRQSGVMRIYLNGSKILQTADTTNDNFCNNGLVIMGGESGSHYPNNYVLGRMDELRYTVGEALYAGDSIDVLPSSEFKNTKVTGIPNDKNYVFRIRGQNSGGYGDYSSESVSTLVAAPPSLSITSEPVNTRVETSNENATFSITAAISDASNPTYQWQAYSLDPNNTCGSSPEWRNISASTASSLTISNSYFPYCNGSYINSVRCLVSSPYETKASKTVRYVDISSVLGGMTFDTYQFDSNFDANYRGYFELGYYGSYDYYADLGWYSGSDTKLKFQYSSDNSTWINTDSAYHYTFRRNTLSSYQNYQIPPIDLSGTVYVRIILEDLWPYNTNNGTSSSTESSYSVVLSTFSYELNPTAPTLMTNFSADPGDRLVVLSWTKGLSGGLPNSTTYTIEYSTDETNWETFTLGFSNSSIYVTGLNGLTNGTTYYFRMKAVNSVGSTSYTSTISATPNVSEATTPSVINNLTAVAGDGKAYLTWDSPASDGQSLPLSYTIRYSRDGGSTWENYVEPASSPTPTPTPTETPTLTPTETPTATPTTTTTTAPAVPGAPTNVAANPYGPNVALNWTDPASNGGSAITGYVVQFSQDGGSWTTTTLTPLSGYRGYFDGDTDSFDYAFRVAAVNSVGTGSFSSPSNAVN